MNTSTSGSFPCPGVQVPAGRWVFAGQYNHRQGGRNAKNDNCTVTATADGHAYTAGGGSRPDWVVAVDSTIVRAHQHAPTAWAWATSKAAPGAAGTTRRPPPYQLLDALQDLLRCWTGTCTTCGRPLTTSRTGART